MAGELVEQAHPGRGEGVADGDGAALLGVRQDVPELLGACDLFVSTSRNEGLPLNVMEAMAAGAAFVAPDIDQVLELALTEMPEPLPAVVDMEEALESERAMVHDDLESNMAEHVTQEKGN